MVVRAWLLLVKDRCILCFTSLNIFHAEILKSIGRSVAMHCSSIFYVFQASVLKCQCGAVDLLSWRERAQLHTTATESELAGDDHQPPPSLAVLGQGCFSYLLLAEQVHSSYLPSVLSHSYLLHINIPHAKALIQR